MLPIIPTVVYAAKEFLFVRIPIVEPSNSLSPNTIDKQEITVDTTVATNNIEILLFLLSSISPEKNEKKKNKAKPDKHIWLVKVVILKFIKSPRSK